MLSYAFQAAAGSFCSSWEEFTWTWVWLGDWDICSACAQGTGKFCPHPGPYHRIWGSLLLIDPSNCTKPGWGMGLSQDPEAPPYSPLSHSGDLWAAEDKDLPRIHPEPVLTPGPKLCTQSQKWSCSAQAPEEGTGNKPVLASWREVWGNVSRHPPLI